MRNLLKLLIGRANQWSLTPLIVDLCFSVRIIAGAIALIGYMMLPAQAASSDLPVLSGENNMSDTPKSKNQPDQKATEQRGKQLREAIEQEYQRLDDAKALTPRSGGNISELVLKFIPVGTSFDDAEQILRSAGFTVGPRGSPKEMAKSPVRVPNPKYQLTAEIIALHGSLFTFRTVSVAVYLTPKDPDNYDKVNEVGGSIYTAYP